MTPRLGRIARQFPELVAAIRETPGEALVTCRRADVWADGWTASVYRPLESPVLVARATDRTALGAFRAAVSRMGTVAA